jgi:hypothetical protein
MAYHFKQLTYTGMGGVDTLTSDQFWLEFLKFMTKSPANGGPGWILKSYGLGRNNTTGAVKSFQLNGNFDPAVVFSDGYSQGGTNTISACGMWFILQEPATNRNYRREFLFQRNNRDQYVTGSGFTAYAEGQAYTAIYYSCQGFLTSATGNGFGSADVTGINPPIAYDMMFMCSSAHRNPGSSGWAYVNPQAYSRGLFSQRNATTVMQNLPWQYTICAADNVSGEGFGWYILVTIKSYSLPIKFFCFDPMVSGSYDSSMQDPVVIYNEFSGGMSDGSISYLMLTQTDGGLMQASTHGYAANQGTAVAFCWAKRPASFTSKTDADNQTTVTNTAQVCRANCYIASNRWGTYSNTLNGKDTCVPLPWILHSYPGTSDTRFWLGQSSIMRYNFQHNIGCMQTVNVSILRDAIHFGAQGSGVIIPWDGSVPQN